MLNLLLVLLLTACTSLKNKNQKSPVNDRPNIILEVTEGIQHPESVVYSAKHDLIFVSNVASGNPLEKRPVAYLSKLSKEGKVLNSQWIKGLHAPKGLTLVGDDLYFTDIHRIVRVNIPQGKITRIFSVKGARFLNDTAADANGNIYASDMFSDTIYKISKNKLSVWVKDTRVAGTNGLYTDGKAHVIAVRWGNDIDPKTRDTKAPGDVVVISLADPTKMHVTQELQGYLDGISADTKGNLWISNWRSGDVYTMSMQGQVKRKFNFGSGTADLSVAKELNLLLVPQMLKNKIIFIQL